MFRLFVTITICVACCTNSHADYACLSGPTHTADRDGDRRINLSEVLRVIQLYQLGGYCNQTGTEDGFAPGACADPERVIIAPYRSSPTIIAETGDRYQNHYWYVGIAFGDWITTPGPSLTIENCNPLQTGLYSYQCTEDVGCEQTFVKVTGIASFEMSAFPNNGPYLATTFSLNGLSLNQILTSLLSDGVVVVGLRAKINLAGDCRYDFGSFNLLPISENLFDYNVTSFDGQDLTDCEGAPTAESIDYNELPSGTTISFELAVKRKDLPDTFIEFAGLRPEMTFAGFNEQALEKQGDSWLIKP